jgi:hypothetical protein
MNPSDINTELLAGDARGKKHIPFAVFAVILIHIILFMILLIAAGCRARAHSARANATRVARQEPAPAAAQAPVVAAAPAADAISFAAENEPVLATEPGPDPVPAVRAALPKASPSAAGAGYYIVKDGDNLGQIARRNGTTVEALKTRNKLKSNLIRTGQKLRVREARHRPDHDA